ncbi:MAG: GAF domain-containing protein [Anaerolineales bacterium]|jgi:PAS domain S-box-containing protein
MQIDEQSRVATIPEASAAIALRLLILEDREDDAELMLAELRKSGFEPQWRRVQTEQDFLAALESQPDLILADWTLSQFSALRALDLVNERGLDAPLIIVSGTIGEDTAVEALKYGGADYVSKDRLARLGLAVHRTMEDRQLRRERKQAQALQEAVYRIAMATEATKSLDDLFSQIHQIISSVMPAENFYITLYDEVRKVLNFPYFKDALDEPHLGDTDPGEGLTAYVLKTGKSLLCTQADFDELERQGAVRLLGLPSAIWLGVPLIVEGKTVGAMVVQHYSDPKAYGEREQHMLEFVSTQVAIAITRKQAEAELERQEGRFRSVTEGSLAGVYIIQDEKYRYVNPAMAQMFGYSIDEMVDRLGPMDLVDPEDRVHVAESIRRRLAGELESDRYTWRGIAKNGTRLSLETLARRWTLGERPASLGTLIDVTERIEAEKELSKVNRALRTLTESDKALVRTGNEQALLDEICRNMVEQGGYRLAWVGLAEQDEQRTIRAVAQAGYEEGYLNTLHLTWADTERGRGPAGTAVRTGKPVIVQDIHTDPNFTLWREEASKRGYASVISLPLLAGKAQPLGTLNIYAAEPNAFNAEEVKLLVELANDLGFGIEALRNREAHRQASVQLERQLVRLESLRTIDEAIASSFDLGITLKVLLDQVTTQLKVDAADVLLLNPRSQMLEHAGARGFRTEALKHTHLRLGEGYAGQAALKRLPIRIPVLNQMPDGLKRSPLLRAEDFAAYFSIPLIAKGRVLGVLEIFHRSPLDPDREWEEFLQTLAAEAALAIDNAGLFSDLQRSNLDLSLAYDATIEGWSRAMDLRDKETEGHTQRVTGITERVALALGMGGDILLHMRRGALLHDIGKMGIPDAILLKPGPLTDEEWDIMRKHPTYALEMLSPITYLRPALDIPYCHHEKWDGTGYPRGMKGEEIPLPARAFAIVDVWDALRSDRPYRSAWPAERVLQYVAEQSGKHFDPRVVETFLRVLKEIGEDRIF